MFKISFIFVLLITNIFAIKYAKIINKPYDFGTFGKTYPISEPNFYDVIDEAKRDFNRTEMVNFMEEARRKAYIVNNNLKNCETDSFHYIDPTFYVNEDIEFNGKIIAKKGQRVNPIEISKLIKPILIIDLENEKQLDFWRNQNQYFIVLAGNGDLDKFSKKYNLSVPKTPLTLIRKFKIKCLPSIITEDGKLYIVKEYRIEK